jgi:hypothetical protein
VAGGIIAKLPPSWRNFATSLKHKRQEFSVLGLIGSLHVEEKARAKDTRARGFDGSSSAHVVQKNNFQSHKSKNKNKFEGKGKFDGKNRHRRLPTSRRRLSIRRKDLAMCMVIRIIGLLADLNALISAQMEIVASPLMLLLVILR